MTSIPESGAARVPDYAKSDILDFDARIRAHRNESSFKVPPAIMSALGSLSTDQLRRYPASTYADLARLAGEKLCVASAGMVFANGSDDLILALSAAYTDGQTNVVLARPTFSMYARAGRLSGADVREVSYAKRWQRDPRALLRACDDNTRLVFLAHPNNPTSDLLDRATLTTLLEALPRALVVVDEAYAVGPGASYFPDVASYDNLVTISTLSKVPGLAGLRCGFAAAHPVVASALRRVMQPNPLTVYAVAAMTAYFKCVIDDQSYFAAYKSFVAESLTKLVAELGPFAKSVTRGHSNFVVFEFGDQAARIARALRVQGIAVRSLSAPELDGALRINALNAAETSELILAVKSVLDPAHA